MVGGERPKEFTLTPEDIHSVLAHAFSAGDLEGFAGSIASRNQRRYVVVNFRLADHAGARGRQGRFSLRIR
jgi:hypothetical protein